MTVSDPMCTDLERRNGKHLVFRRSYTVWPTEIKFGIVTHAIPVHLHVNLC